MTGITGDDLDAGPFDDEDFNDEDFNEEGNDPEQDFGDDADPDGESGGSLDSSVPAEEGMGGREEGQVKQPSRATARVEAAIREAREARERAAALETQLQQLTQNQTRASDEQAEAQRVAQMDPFERAEYFARRAEQRALQTEDRLRAEMAEMNDRAAFASLCATNPAIARIKDKVETALADARRGGVTVPRETLAAFLIGQEVLAKAPAARARAGKKGAAAVSRERARPVSSGSDVTSGRTRDDRAARLERLANASI